MMRRTFMISACLATFCSTLAHAAPDTAQPSGNLPPARSSHDPLPPPPSPIADHELGVVRQAGVGSEVAYGRSGVLELGGGISWAQSSNGMQLSVSPTIGWFFADNFELSGILQATHSRIGDKASDTFVTALVEPSAHIPVMDNLFIFGGLGVGATYEAAHHSTGFALAPRAGVNVLIGRSGVLTPSVAMNWSTNSSVQTPEGTLMAVNATWGLNMNYSVMF